MFHCHNCNTQGAIWGEGGGGRHNAPFSIEEEEKAWCEWGVNYCTASFVPLQNGGFCGKGGYIPF